MARFAITSLTFMLLEVPEPVVSPGTVLVRTSYSLISAGTEMASLGGGGKRESLAMKAVRNPDLVRKVLTTRRQR